MKVIFTLIGADVVLGLINGYINKELNSKFGLTGVIKHSVVVLLIIVFKFIATECDIMEYHKLFMVFYIIQYSFSILETIYKMGIPVPKFLLARLKEYQESEGLEKWEK